MRLANPADFLAQSPGSDPQVSPSHVVNRRRRTPIRATQGTVRAMRLVRRAAVWKFGRGKTKMEYRNGRWVIHLYNYSGQACGLYLAYDVKPGIDHTGVDFQLIPARRI
jgi:hypothetical protein